MGIWITFFSKKIKMVVKKCEYFFTTNDQIIYNKIIIIIIIINSTDSFGAGCSSSDENGCGLPKSSTGEDWVRRKINHFLSPKLGFTYKKIKKKNQVKLAKNQKKKSFFILKSKYICI
jgi:hypothetical protein